MSRKLVVELVGDSRSLEKAFGRSSKSAKEFNRSVTKTSGSSRAFRSVGRSVTGLAGTFIGAYGLASAAKAAFDEMGNAQKVSAQTRAALKSTRGAARVTAKQIDTLATSLMNLSGQDDEVIKSGENMLLTFTNVRNQVGKGNDIFNRATKATLDMSTALGEDVPSAALKLGKALNDPIRGVTSLRRVGVQFTDDQTKLIKRLVETGHTMDAQKLILRELNKEFGGSAKAAGETLPGKLNILRQNALNLGGAMAKTLSPAINKAADGMTKWLQNTKNQKELLDGLAAAIRGLGRAFQFAARMVRDYNKANAFLRKHGFGGGLKDIADRAQHNLGLPGGGLLKMLGITGDGKQPRRVRPPAGPRGPVGYRPAAQGVHISGPVTVVANNPQEFLRALDRRKRRGAVSRTGPRAGQRGD